MPVTKTRPAGATGTSWHDRTSWIMGRGVAESRDCNSEHKYIHKLGMSRTGVLSSLIYLTFTMESGLYLKDHCLYLNSSYFVVNLRI